MKLLVDANLSPTLATALTRNGYDAVHVADVDLLRASDAAILRRAANDGLVLVTTDHDFGAMLALSGATRPSVIHLRGVAELPTDVHRDLLVRNLSSINDDVENGAIVSLSPQRLAVRRLPIK